MHVAVLASIAITLYPRMESAPFHIDEAAWIGFGYYYHLLFEKGDIHSKDWKTLRARRDFPVGKYLYGLGLTIQGHPVRNLKIYNTFGQLWYKPYELARAVPTELLFAGRRVSWVFGCLAVWLIYLMVARVSGIVGGIGTVVLLLINPVTIVLSKALVDSMLLSCLAGGGLAVLSWRRGAGKLKPARVWAVAVSMGALTGIAAAVKANGAILGFYLALAVLWVCLRRKSRPAPLWHAIAALAAAGALAVAVFVAVNPTLYSHPVAEITRFLSFKSKNIALQQEQIGPAVRGLADKIAIVAKRVMISGPYTPFPLSGLLSLAGVAWLLKKSTGGQVGGEILLLLWCAVLYGAVTLWLPLDWERYYLPAAAAAAVPAGAAIGGIAKLAYCGLKRLKRP